MADISITLVLDDSQYQASLKNVQQSSNNTTKAIKTGFDEAGKSIDDTAKKANSFKNAASDLTGQFSKLATAIVGASLIGFISSAMESASAATRMAEALGISTASYLEFSKAATASGKDADAFGRMMLRLQVTAEQANEGNLRLQLAYEKLGVSMEFLKTHSPDEVMLKVSKALLESGSSGERLHATFELLGRDAKTFDFSKFVEEYEKARGTQDEFAQATRDASEAYRQIQLALVELKLEVIKLIDPLLQLIGSNASGLIGSATAAKIFLGVLSVTVIGAFAAAAMALFTALSSLVTGFAAAATAAGVFLVEMLPIIAGIAAAAGAAWLLNEGIKKAFGVDVLDEFGKKLGPMIDGAKDKIKEFASSMMSGLGLKPGVAAPETKINGGGGTVGSHTYDAGLGAQKAQLEEQFKLQQFNNALAEARIRLEIQLAGASEETRKSQLAQFDENKKYAEEYLKIQGKIHVAEAQRNASPEAAAKASSELVVLRQQLEVLKQHQGVMGALEGQLVSATQQRQIGLLYEKESLKIADNVKNIETEIADLSRTTNEKKIADIQKQIDKDAKVMADEQMKLLGRKLTEQEILDIRQKIAATYDPEILKTQELINKSRDFGTALQQAVNDTIEAGTNRAQQARDMVNSVFSNMNSAIDDFVSKGKFSFANFATSVIQDLIKIQLKAAAMDLFKGLGLASGAGSAGGGILSFFSNLFKADGGPVTGGQSYIVGEKGPEIFTPSSGGSITANNKINNAPAAAQTMVTYNINAVDSQSFQQMLARDPSFIYALSLQGQKAMPSTRI
jgi:hypothetical protein